MKKAKREKSEEIKVVQQPVSSSLSLTDLDMSGAGCTNTGGRPLAEAHIESCLSGGRRYYRYRRGTEKPIHLGTADAILRAVKLRK